MSEQDKISLPMSKLAAVSNIIRAKQNADITVKLGGLALTGAARTTRFAMLGYLSQHPTKWAHCPISPLSV
nr:hypothetical protein [Ruegeria atlantica]